jgi:hypothetical protein
MSTLQAHAEKRIYERYRHTIPIEFSYFNKRQFFENYAFNNSLGGMNFKSGFFVQPGSTVLIRVKQFHPNNTCTGACNGLRTFTLAEVKWCENVKDANDSYYKVGVK